MKKLAIYDLDRTITRWGTFTPFLIFVARRRPWRFPLLLLYFLSLLAVPIKLLDGKGVKQIGFRLLIGHSIAENDMAKIAADYAAHVHRRNVYADALDRIADDKEEGCCLVIATAAPDYYAVAIGRVLGFDHVISTVHRRNGDDGYSYRIESDNCHGREKLNRIKAWFAFARDSVEIRFYSDHHSDQPVFEWADRAFATNPNARLRVLAQERGWAIIDFG
jgi:HAD superfamily phosphoserine phosphatase-like hydrolase